MILNRIPHKYTSVQTAWNNTVSQDFSVTEMTFSYFRNEAMHTIIY